jgi:hypothetical protein
MTGTLAVTAGRGEAGLRRGRAAAGLRPGCGRAAKALYRPVGPAAIRVSYSVGIYPRKKYAGRRYKVFPGYYGGYYAEDGRDDTALPGYGKPSAARYETRRIGDATGPAAAGSFNGPIGIVAGKTPRSPKPDSGHIGTVSHGVQVRWASQNAMKPR